MKSKEGLNNSQGQFGTSLLLLNEALQTAEKRGIPNKLNYCFTLLNSCAILSRLNK